MANGSTNLATHPIHQHQGLCWTERMWHHRTQTWPPRTYLKKLWQSAAGCQRTQCLSITSAQRKQYWKAVNEKTSSSESGIHFGHYVVGCKSTIILHYHAARVTVVVNAHAIQLERWSWGLSAMLEKNSGK
jgi:hypothetical protein